MILLRLLLIISLINGEFLFFERDSYEFYISESAPINTKIGIIKVTSSSSLLIQYKLYGDTNQLFNLNSSTGELTLLNSLDYETTPMYKLTIEARSTSTVSPSFSEIIIHVINTNDNPPEINLIFYPSVLFESNLIKYDLHTYSTPLATINIKDLDESTRNLTLSINDTKHFQIQSLRQRRNGLITESIYILSTKNNAQLLGQEYYYLSLNSCDNDQPLLWTNRSYEFRMKPNENLCSFLNTSTIDIKPNRSLISTKLTNQFCQNLNYSIDDLKNFYIDSQTGYLYTSKIFNREEQSIYKLHIQAIDQYNRSYKTHLTIQILDDYGHIPFLIKKKLRINKNEFFSIDLFNSTYCRYQPRIYNSFRLLTNCTLVKFSSAVQGKYLIHIQLNEQNNYEDTFLLELTSNLDEKNIFLILIQSEWILIIPIILGIFLILIIILCSMMIIRKRRYNQIHQNKQKSSSLSNSEESIHNSKYISNLRELSPCQLFYYIIRLLSFFIEYDAISTLSKLKVHDDQDLSSSSPGNTAIYLIQKSLSSSPTRDDEGYSGSSDVSENHLPVETTIISANQLLEQYRIYDFHTRQSISPLSYDVSSRNHATCISPDVSLV